MEPEVAEPEDEGPMEAGLSGMLPSVSQDQTYPEPC